ncbi:unnamed protein product [Symbiodinium natans]|uniref:DUF6815 domain-containing protein n=1 Tax=Symbiodinium natans TaxID=878477 RepID=A0A812QVR3_9DINO|nr:unnamed protein product [Symbiodinium natans]
MQNFNTYDYFQLPLAKIHQLPLQMDLAPQDKTKLRAVVAAPANNPTPGAGPGGAVASGHVDCSSITAIAKDCRGLKEQPSQPKFKGALVQVYVRGAPFGGSDKSSNGHRFDSITLANGMIESGMSCQLLHYTHEEHEHFFSLAAKFDFIIVRCDPGQIKADGGDQQKFDDGMRKLRKQGVQIWPSPDGMEKMAAKDALCKVASMSIGLPDTLAYYSEQEFAQGFKKAVAFQPRVIRHREGIWTVKLKAQNYCSEFGQRCAEDTEVLVLMEDNDNHEEEHTVAEFIEFCVNGHSDKAGKWTSKGAGKYLAGGKEAGGQLVDQRFCPRKVEGELRYNMIADTLVGITHEKPKAGGISVGGTGSVYTYFGSDEPQYQRLTRGFLDKDLPLVMPALGLDELPLWWTADFINSSPEGTDEKWIVSAFNCSCASISRCLAACCKDDTPNASYDDISAEDKAEADKHGKLIGEKAAAILSKK